MIIPTTLQDFDIDGRITGVLYCDTISGKYVFYYDSKWWISSTFPTCNEGFVTEFYTLNGKNYWYLSPDYIWYSTATACYRKGEVLGFDGILKENVDPEEQYDSEEVEVEMDDFTESNSTTLMGEYTNGEIIGCTRHTDQDSIEYIQSIEKISGYFIYGTIHHDGTGWLIGTRDNDPETTKSWWSGSEPGTSGAVTFTKKGAAEEDKIVTFQEFIARGASILGFDISIFYE